ncbi:MAG TPA: hypothetical protein VFH80_21325, partial [Solirubrobacteraceae bacterium]|nr:hypothetical protein [Solirubrobacteraceae bacterium]
KERRAVFEELFASCSARLSDASDLHERARLALTNEALRYARRALERGEGRTADVDDLVEFASDTYPKVSELAAWRRYQRRAMRGGASGPSRLSCQARAAVVRARTEYAYLRWSSTGL